MSKKKVLALITIVLTLCFTLSGCLGILGGLINGIDLVFNMVDSFGGQEKLPENVVYGSDNDLAVGFENGKMIAFWDAYVGESYVVSVTVNDITTSYDPADERYTDYYDGNKFLFEKADINYADNFTVSLRRIAENNTYTTDRYTYSAITDEEYATYTANVPGGFTDIDYYIADRYELFEFFAYLIVFRPDETEVKEKKDVYTKVEKSVKMAYDYAGLYGIGVSKSAAFESEMMSAVASFEDSAAYNYSYEIDENDVGSIFLKFYYKVDPTNNTDAYNKYINATTLSEKAHYSTAVYSERTFPIDSITKTVTVSSGDQLYFAIKKGYKPLPVAGSRAELLYNRMRLILSYINEDGDNQPIKIHRIYDYLVNTVIYDYVFTEQIIKDDSVSSAETFAYKCLYLEGVFGLANDGTFNPNQCVAICDGLSKAFLCLTRIEGITSLKISGTASGGAHAWNKVRVNNRWYMVDTTWGNQLDGNREYLSHDYLMVPDDNKHTEDKWYYYPAATGRYNFGFIS